MTQQVFISATFTGEPVTEVVELWNERLGLDLELVSAPGGQVFQSLLDRRSESATNVLLVRFEDWVGASADLGTAAARSAVEQNTRDFLAALAAARTRSPRQQVVAVCPLSASARADDAFRELSRRLETLLSEELTGKRGVILVCSDELLARHGGATYDDPHAEELAHIPYSTSFIACVGTQIARTLHALLTPPRKVIVLDCDQTLWRGVCGEDGVAGIVIDAARRDLQRFMLTRHEVGFLLCLASKNEEEDIEQVFAERSEMLIKRDHIVASRVNWLPKSENLRSLSAQLGLALDAFIFVDDDAVVCAEVEATCPEVLTLRLPSDEALIPSFLANVWAFDRLGVTEEDRARPRAYKEEAEREKVRRSSTNLGDFLATLELEVAIRPARAEDAARLAQLTQRTNQFNTTTIRSTEAEIESAIRTGTSWIVVAARDRFGDYGDVGATTFRTTPDALVVDAMMLSCRALARGVEHRMLAHLAGVAKASGLRQLEIAFARSRRNAPAAAFLTSIAGARLCEGPGRPAYYAMSIDAALEAEPREVVEIPSEAGETRATATARRAPPPWSTIALELGSDAAVEQAMIARLPTRTEHPDARGRYVAPRTDVEARVAAIWQTVLGIERVSVEDNLFGIGGDSLRLIQILSRIRAEFGVNVTFNLSQVTVADFAALIQAPTAMSTSESDIDDILDELAADEEARETPHVETSWSAPLAQTPREEATIDVVAIITCDRPEGLARAAASAAARATRAGRGVEIAVFDDSTKADVRSANRESLRSIRDRFGVQISYAGIEQKQRFVRALVESSGVPADVVQFALLGRVGALGDVGARGAGPNRNCALLHSIGDAFLSLDDDVECVLSTAPGGAAEEKTGLVVGRDPAEFWFYPTPEEALASGAAVEEDLRAAHERILGRVSETDMARSESPIPWPSVGDVTLPERIARGGEVYASFSGLAGDCGWGPPFGYWGMPMGFLVLDEASHERMVASRSRYEVAATSRQLVRVARRPSISDAQSISAVMALDGRKKLPPFLPVSRTEDVVFGKTLWRCYPDACFGHTSRTFRHLPLQRRSYAAGEVLRGARAYDVGKLFTDAIQTCHFGAEDVTADLRLASLGRHLSALGGTSAAEFLVRLREQRRRADELFGGWVRAHLQARRTAPDYWRRDVEAYLLAMSATEGDDDALVPLDLARASSGNAALTVAQRLLDGFGKLLLSWNSLDQAARELRRRGVRVARPLDET